MIARMILALVSVLTLTAATYQVEGECRQNGERVLCRNVTAFDEVGDPPPPPPPPPPADSDGDGVPDSEDACPTEAGPASNNGCPEVDPPPPPPGDTPYDLGELPGYLSALRWPDEPGVGGCYLIVRSQQELSSSLTSGCTVDILAGTYDSVDLTSSHSDIRFIASRDAVFTGEFSWRGPQRISWSGGKLRGTGQGWVYIEGSDILIDNVSCDIPGACIRPRPGLKRFALINSTVHSRDQFTILMGSGTGREDMIFANVLSINDGTQTACCPSPFRISGGTSRVVIVDSFFESGTDNNGGVRLQYDTTDIYFARNVVNAADGEGRNLLRMEGDASRNNGRQLGPAVVEDNHFYTDSAVPWTIGNASDVFAPSVFQRNSNHSRNCIGLCEAFSPGSGHTSVYNVHVGYEAPDASQHGADH